MDGEHEGSRNIHEAVAIAVSEVYCPLVLIKFFSTRVLESRASCDQLPPRILRKRAQ